MMGGEMNNCTNENDRAVFSIRIRTATTQTEKFNENE